MLEWPGRCTYCGQEINSWTEAGLFDRRWIHKTCYTAEWNSAHNRGASIDELRPPTERGSQLEMPMLIFLLMFHFGLGGAVAGWIMLDQNRSESIAAILLVVGIVVPLIGLAGIAVNIMSRRRIELIRREVDASGGWKPGN